MRDVGSAPCTFIAILTLCVLLLGGCSNTEPALDANPSTNTTALSEVASPTQDESTPTDSDEWTFVPIAELDISPDQFTPRSIDVVNGKYVAIGSNRSNTSTAIDSWYSADGLSWTGSDLADVAASNQLSPNIDILFPTETGLHVVAGNGTLFTTDGISWDFGAKPDFVQSPDSQCRYINPNSPRLGIATIDACGRGPTFCKKPEPLQIRALDEAGNQLLGDEFELDGLISVGFSDSRALIFGYGSELWRDESYIEPEGEVSEQDCWDYAPIYLAYIIADIESGSLSSFVETNGAPGGVGGNSVGHNDGDIVLGGSMFPSGSGELSPAFFELRADDTEVMITPAEKVALGMEELRVVSNGSSSIALAAASDIEGRYIAGVYYRD